MEKCKDKQLARKEVLLKTSKIMNDDAFRGLRSLYINIFPYSIKIDTPIELFHYLDCIGYLSIKELTHNLRSMGYRESLKHLEEYMAIYGSKDISTKKHPGEIVKILKNALRLSDIGQLGFIFDKDYSNRMDDVLIDICSYGLGMYLEPKHILNLLSNHGIDVTLMRKSIPAKLELSPLMHECRKIEEKIFVLNISRYFDDDETLQSLMFMYKIPVRFWETIENGFDLFKYLYSKQTMNLQKLSEYGTLTKFPTLANKIQEFLKIHTEPKICCCEEMINFRNTLVKAKDVLANNSKQIVLSDFLAHLLGNIPTESMELTKIALLLISFERFDIVKSINRMGLGKMSKAVPEGAAYSNEEFRLFQLKFSLDSIMIRKLAKLYNLDCPFFFTGEFLTYLCVHGLSDVQVLKENLKKIGSSDLIPLLDCYE